MIALLLFSIAAHASDLTVVNNTGSSLRIESLNNKCSGELLKAPLYITTSHTFTVTPVVHTYMVCGSGFCESSAVGFRTNSPKVITVSLNTSGVLQTSVVPEEFPGNLECK